MTKFPNKFKKPPFWPFSPYMGQKKYYQKILLSFTALYWFLRPCQNLEKTNDLIPRKRLDGWMDRPYFIGPFRLPLLVQSECP